MSGQVQAQATQPATDDAANANGATNLAPVVPLPVVVKGPAEANVDLYPLTPEAWNFYCKKDTLGNHSYRQFISRGDLVRVARALRRQVTKEELETFAGLDCEFDAEGKPVKVKCSATNREFVPVGFIIFTRAFIDRIAREGKVDAGWAPHCGCFFIKEDPRSETVFVASGHRWAWNTEKEFHVEWEPLVKAFKANDQRWGMTQFRAMDIIAERRQARERKAAAEGRINDTVCGFFEKGKFDVAKKEFVPRTSDTTGGRRDRRPVVPAKK